jgi:DNA-binding NarL/FixJ family response regulator
LVASISYKKVGQIGICLHMSEHRQILVIEDLPTTREWLIKLVETTFPDCHIEAASTLSGALYWLKGQTADLNALCLVDLGLPDGSGIDFIRALMHKAPHAHAVVTTLYDDDANLLNAMAAGASGYILKDQEPELIGTRLAAIERGEVAMSPSISRRIMAHFQNSARFVTATSDVVILTPRETDVLRLIGRGLRNGEAATALGISKMTVTDYIKTIYRKLDVSSRAEAALEASRRGLV